MSDDLIERLRSHAAPKSWHTKGHPMNDWVGRHGTQQICGAAADRIEELEAALREIRDAPVGALRTTIVREVFRRALDGGR